MKPTSEAIEAAILEADANIANRNQHEWFCKILTAAYAAQFQSKDYAGLVEQLRFIDEDTLNIEPYSCEQLCKKAADLIEALCARLAPAPVNDEALVEAMADAMADAAIKAIHEAKDETLVVDVRRISMRAAFAIARPVIEEQERQRWQKMLSTASQEPKTPKSGEVE